MPRTAFASCAKHCATFEGQIIHSDVFSFEDVSRKGYNLWATFINDYTKDISVYPMKSKDPTFTCFKHFKARFENKNVCSIKSLVSEDGGKYVLTEFGTYLLGSGVFHKPGPPHYPELNSVAERANCTLCNHVRCCLIRAHLPKLFWVDALCHIVFPINSIPCHTPAGFNSPNSISKLLLVDPTYLHPFGCLVWYKVQEANCRKLDPQGRVFLLLSYLSHGNGYRVWDLERQTVIKTQDVVFWDDVFPYLLPLHSAPSSPPTQIEVDLPLLTFVSPTPPPAPCIHIFWSDCRLEASSHNPVNLLPPHLMRTLNRLLRMNHQSDLPLPLYLRLHFDLRVQSGRRGVTGQRQMLPLLSTTLMC